MATVARRFLRYVPIVHEWLLCQPVNPPNAAHQDLPIQGLRQAKATKTSLVEIARWGPT